MSDTEFVELLDSIQTVLQKKTSRMYPPRDRGCSFEYAEIVEDSEYHHALANAYTGLCKLQAENAKLRAELEQVKAERDAAVRQKREE